MIKKLPQKDLVFKYRKTKKALQLTFLMVLFILLGNSSTYGQCLNYEVYESFNGSSIPTSGGTWAQTSITFGTTFPRTGDNSIVFNAANDAIRTPLITNPGIFSFWYRRNNNTTAHSFAIQTSPNGTTWTTRGTTTTPTDTYQQYTLDVGALGLTNIYIRILDTRASGTHNRIVDDISWTSTVAANNTVIPALANCSQTITCGTTYTFTDAGGQNDRPLFACRHHRNEKYCGPDVSPHTWRDPHVLTNQSPANRHWGKSLRRCWLRSTMVYCAP